MSGSRVFLICALLSVAAVTKALAQVRYVDATADSGIRFRHTDGRSGRKYLPETLGSGAAFLDYDSDGDIDLYIVNAADLPGAHSPSPPTNALYRNDGSGHFDDVTAEAGVGHTGYGVGCAVADYDNDGRPDIYVTNYGANVLYHNDGDGTFTDATAHAGVGDARWGTSCAFLDYDRDGFLDLYVVNYMEFSTDRDERWETKGVRTYASPVDQIAGSVFVSEPDILYRNNGDGTFADVTAAAGITGRGLGLALAVGDYDDDGDPDMHIANDMEPDFLYRNNGDGSFTNAAPFAGVAYDQDGMPGSGMGASFGDMDNDGRLDLVVSNAAAAPALVFRNEGLGMFADVSFPSGVGQVTLPRFQWSAEFLDYDNDGQSDIYIASGHLQDNIALFSDESYAQPDVLLRNRGDGRFADVSVETGVAALTVEVSRGVAAGDIDNDGDVDLFLTNSNRAARLLRNDGGAANQWLMCRTVGTVSNRDGIGARIRVVAGGLSQVKEVRSGSGYLSQGDLRVLFGLGRHATAELVEVRWPTGLVDRWRDVPAPQIMTLTEGEGR
ncbi:CRTAC1 family protein [Candidatus Poribacteria bacterium]|nr:CRTAC1 family protein [Candidatus Poribacteria bacterium]MBT5534542.1 CRTAC1 family protein [Candidatus Poribacteria bacterium]MBT5711607.1 CRTAC1 family protein [Candidatus Poribacteria bacterium]MBT7097205.1 CRTAC1 family protein [Candidatus Poribacteria bacterium]MBT7805698.1 CRTAC1 family protein [Candidatus Poribacteria bacterium]